MKNRGRKLIYDVNIIINPERNGFVDKNDSLIFNRPASCFGEMWRDALPLGNGLTGALVHGGVFEEEIIINRYDLWHGAKKCRIPDMADVLRNVRDTMDRGKYEEAENMFCDELRKQGYDPAPGSPFPLVLMKIQISSDGMFSNYSRILEMNTGMCLVQYNEKDNSVQRRCFVSKKEDIIVFNIKSEKTKKIKITLDLYDDKTENTVLKRKELEKSLKISYEKDSIYFSAENGDKPYGAIVTAKGAEACGNSLVAETKELTVTVKCFSEKIPERITGKDFQTLLEEHIPLHEKLYKSVDINLFGETGHTNSQLLDIAYENVMPTELIEKLWKFGRYLFISGTAESGNPFALYGLWHANYDPPWSQYVANENVQISYWHTAVGGLSHLVKPLILYYCSHMEEYREAAKKLFGCRGIYLGVYTSPLNHQPAPVVPVIIHYISVAGWLCRHFYEYYKMTEDTEMLEKYILPFMLETAEFYEDYALYDENGKMQLYPSVSPENSPKNFTGEMTEENMGHPMPVARNATMDFAILKELLANLLTLDISDEKREIFQNMLTAIPPYQVNADGAIKEWMFDEFEDNYFHRHLSHIYPVFPGEEISEDDKLFENFKTAVDKRILQSSTSWSLSHMSGIYCRLGDGENAMECLDIMCKGCILTNFMTLHNDYRNMGITANLGEFAPVMLDATQGFVNAVQMMLFQFVKNTILFLPALPARLSAGEVKGFEFPGGKTDFSWDLNNHSFSAAINITRDMELKIKLPGQFENFEIKTNGVLADAELVVKKGDILLINN